MSTADTARDRRAGRGCSARGRGPRCRRAPRSRRREERAPRPPSAGGALARRAPRAGQTGPWRPRLADEPRVDLGAASELAVNLGQRPESSLAGSRTVTTAPPSGGPLAALTLPPWART